MYIIFIIFLSKEKKNNTMLRERTLNVFVKEYSEQYVEGEKLCFIFFPYFKNDSFITYYHS